MKLSELVKKHVVKFENGLEVVVKEEVGWLEFTDMMGIVDAKERGVAVLTAKIVSWNMTDDKGKVLPISKEIVRVLPRPIAQKLVNAIAGREEETVKKKTK